MRKMEDQGLSNPSKGKNWNSALRMEKINTLNISGINQFQGMDNVKFSKIKRVSL
jgi:hypothetical protein